MPFFDSNRGDVSDASALARMSNLANFRNILDGGDFTVNPWQRNVAGLASGGVISSAITNTPTYFPDRWFGVGGASSSLLLANVADTTVPGFSTSCLMSRTAANSNTANLSFGQVIEQLDVIKCQGQTVSFSFWARTAANYSGGALTVQLISGTGNVANGTAANMISSSWTGQASLSLLPGQAGSAAGTAPAQTLTSTMTRYTFTTAAAVPSNVTQLGVLLTWTPTGTAGTTDGIYFNGLQLEVGLPSLFEHRDVQVETEICQRYCWVIAEPAAAVVVGTGSLNSTTAAIIYMATPVQMRAAPTVTVSAGTFHAAPAGATASGTIAAGSTHTANAITINLSSITASTAGFGTPLVGGGGSGYIIASADL